MLAPAPLDGDLGFLFVVDFVEVVGDYFFGFFLVVGFDGALVGDPVFEVVEVAVFVDLAVDGV